MINEIETIIRKYVAELFCFLREHNYKKVENTELEFSLNIPVIKYQYDNIEIYFLMYKTGLTEIRYISKHTSLFSIMLTDIKTTIFCNSLIILNVYEYEKNKKYYNAD